MAREEDEKFMRVALALAEKGAGNTSPNPLVGCVVVKDGKIVGTDWHKKFGGPHAEVNALRNAGEKAAGATLYVNLEPCSHFGKTPPCTRAIIEAGIGRVVCAMRDPHKLAAGGIERLASAAGIPVKCGVLEQEALRLNEAFVKFATTATPFVIVKAAASRDGFIAPLENAESGKASGRGRERKRGKAPKWISCAESRGLVHELRRRCDAVLVGAGTVLEDDPRLTCRLGSGRNAKQPIRIILDSRLRTPLNSKAYADSNALVATARGCGAAKKRALEKKGIEVLECPVDGTGIDLAFLLEALGKRGISSVLVEGGSRVFSSFLKKRLADKFLLFVAPTALGRGVPLADPQALECLEKLERVTEKRVGKDVLFQGYFPQTAEKWGDPDSERKPLLGKGAFNRQNPYGNGGTRIRTGVFSSQS